MTTTYTYCRVCRHNHNHGKKHRYQTKHKVALEKTLNKEAAKVQEYRYYINNVTLSASEETANSWCMFCDKEIPKESNRIACFATLQHFATKDHKRRVIEFLKEMGCASDNRTKYLLTKGEFHKFASRAEEILMDLENKKLSTLTNSLEHKLANGVNIQSPLGPSSPISTSPGTGSSSNNPSQIDIYNNSNMSPDVNDAGGQVKPTEGAATPVEPPKAPRTVISMNGIKQNPTGWSEGERVWGGGIVKYKKGSIEWIPWPIDLDNEGDTFESTSLMGGTMPVVRDGVIKPPSGSGPVPSIQTEFAFGENLTALPAQPLAEGEGNVHSGAIPPWMMDDEGKPIPTIVTGLTLADREKDRNRRKKQNKKKIGSDINRQEQTYWDSWLPDFGRVWQAGPRSHTRREFQTEQWEERKVQANLSKLTATKQTSPSASPEETVGTGGITLSERQRIKEKLMQKRKNM
jgi:hypothetical protein